MHHKMDDKNHCETYSPDTLFLLSDHISGTSCRQISGAECIKRRARPYELAIRRRHVTIYTFNWQ